MPWPKETKYLGKPTPRLDAVPKVTGAAKYTSDVTPPGVLYGAIFRSPVPAATIKAIDVAKARALPGIKAVVLVREPPFQVRFYGEELAGVAGTSRAVVEKALQLIALSAESSSFVVTEADAMSPEAPRVFADHDNVTPSPVKETGQVDAAFASAAAVVEGVFSTPALIHNMLEPHGNTIAYGADEIVSWSSTQGVFSVRDGLAENLGVPLNKVRVICDYMGGGFGAKVGLGVEGSICAQLSKAAGAPVKLMLSRREQALSVGNRASSTQKIKLGADKDGKLVAFELDAFGSPGFAAGASTAAGSASANIPAPYIYTVPNTRVKQANVSLNAGSSRAMRAPACPPASFGIESILDELAVKLGVDPVELRIKNDPFDVRRREYALAAEKFGWKEKYRAPGSSPGPVKRGVGCAGAAWGGGGRRTQAEIQINADGTVEVRCGTQDLGTGSRTVAAIVAAEILQVDLAHVTARVGDTRLPPSGASGGSSTTPNVAPAVFNACENALKELSKVSGIDDPRGARWTEACGKIGLTPLIAAGSWQPGLSSSGSGGVQFAEVEVDTETGFVRVKKVLCVQDCGLIVNTLTTRSQVNGGIIMGLGYALYEQRVMDRNAGVVLNPNFETYKIPGAADIPEIEVILLDMPERGVIGVGEPVTIPTASAIANAVANALGVRVSSLPITPDKVLAALGKVPSAQHEAMIDPNPADGPAGLRFSDAALT